MKSTAATFIMWGGLVVLAKVSATAADILCPALLITSIVGRTAFLFWNPSFSY
jgi:hypothetical protein